MASSRLSYALANLTWQEVRDHLEGDRRLLVPIGTCDQYGPHLPIGASTRVVEALVHELSEEFGVLCAPTLYYGVNVPGECTFPGSATLAEKTLHRVLNDLLSSWEAAGIDEFILLTAQAYDPHIEAIATVSVSRARARVIDVLGTDFSPLVQSRRTAEHGGELLTSLILFLSPEAVRLDQVVDVAPSPQGMFGGLLGSTVRRLPGSCEGVVGSPSRATAEQGRVLYQYLLEKIRTNVFGGGVDTFES